MIIHKLRELQSIETESTWNSLRRFHNVHFVTKRISDLHGVPSDQVENVAKQAEQIRHCLSQAREYFDAARAVSLATKPVLMYYGIMSLALAEILFKQDGMSSLDRARQKNSHHGLEFKVDGRPTPTSTIQESGAMLRACPFVSKGKRFGTFALWHRTSREPPLAGLVKREVDGGHVMEARLLGTANDSALPEVGPRGVTLWDCLLRMPELRSFLDEIGEPRALVRAQFEMFQSKGGETRLKLMIQPGNSRRIDEVRAQLLFGPELIDRIQVQEFPSGFVAHIHLPQNYGAPRFLYPMVFQSSVDEFLFPPGGGELNEFGLLYTSLYILGNYARYYPDAWMVDVERSSPLAIAAEALVAAAEERATILTLSELTQTAHLLERRKGAQH